MKLGRFRALDAEGLGEPAVTLAVDDAEVHRLRARAMLARDGLLA